MAYPPLGPNECAFFVRPSWSKTMAREELKWQNIDADDLPAEVKKSFDAMVEAEATFKADLEKLLKGRRSYARGQVPGYEPQGKTSWGRGSRARHEVKAEQRFCRAGCTILIARSMVSSRCSMASMRTIGVIGFIGWGSPAYAAHLSGR